MKKVISTIVATAFLASCSTVNKFYDDVTTGETRNEVSNKSSEVTSEVSAYENLNDCTFKKQAKGAVIGAAVGAVGGALIGLATGKTENAAKGALIGAAVGGTGNWLFSLRTAYDDCVNENPQWVKKSELQHPKNRSVAKVKKELKYKEKNGIVGLVKSFSAPKSVKASDKRSDPINVKTTFYVMTPDDGPSDYTIKRSIKVLNAKSEEIVKLDNLPESKESIPVGMEIDKTGIPFIYFVNENKGGKVVYTFQLFDKDGKLLSEKSTNILIK